jgi:hypothetical protein
VISSTSTDLSTVLSLEFPKPQKGVKLEKKVAKISKENKFGILHYSCPTACLDEHQSSRVGKILGKSKERFLMTASRMVFDPEK